MLNVLLQEELQEIKDQREGFKINDLNGANWCFRKLRALQEKIQENKRLADEERARIDAWESKENEDAQNSIEYFEGLLTEYYMELKKESPKAKISTPYGKVSSRKTKKWNYTNDEKLLNYLRNDYKKFIRVTEEVNKAELKKAFKNGVNPNTGEILPGVTVVEEENITIKVEE